MPISSDDLLVALALAHWISRASACRLALELDRWREAAEDDAPELSPELGIPEGPLRKALKLRRSAGPLAARAREEAARHDARIVTRGGAGYPQELDDLELPPPALWVRGRLPPGPRIAIVGSRRMSWYGRKVAATFGRELAARGLPVVSGFARGIDTTAHEAALEPENGRTVAVLGCGLDVDYPRRSRRRADAIADAGALITELAPGTKPRGHFFPLRNRILAALGVATLVVQAAVRSGSLVTARHALELGRDVWAVPGEIFDEGAMGTNALIADGAFVARSTEDLIEGLSFRGFDLDPDGSAGDGEGEVGGVGAAATRRSGPAGRIVDFLVEEGSSTAEAIAAALDVGVERALALLLDLELDGTLRREPGPRWRV